MARAGLGGSAFTVFGLLLAGVAAADEAPTLSLPLDCGSDTPCTIVRLVDHDPGPEAADWRCGPRTSGNHDGTDIAPLDPTAAPRVLAAAPGTVLGVRNDMPDRNVVATGPQAVAGRECGNGLVIDHGNGWHTQYCHLSQGSVTVQPGSVVTRGQELGRVGLSGLTELPHLHLTVRHKGSPVDPFTGTGQSAACSLSGQPLWDAPAQAVLSYAPRLLYLAGFAAAMPERLAARAGTYRAPLPADAPALLLWSDVLAPRAGDVLRFEVIGPDGRSLLGHDIRMDKDHVQWFGYAGVKRRGAAWPPGRYLGRITLRPAGGGAPLVLESTGMVGP